MQRESQSYWREADTSPGVDDSSGLLEEMLTRPAGPSGGFSLEREVEARPLFSFGAAVLGGIVLGSLADRSSPSTPGSEAWLAPIDRELDIVKSAAVAALSTAALDQLRGLVPGQTGQALTSLLSRRLQSMGVAANPHSATPAAAGRSNVGSVDFGGTQTSSAPNSSFDAGAGKGALGYDSPPAQGGSGSIENTRVSDTAHLDPYYPPGGAEQPIAGGATPGVQRGLDPREAQERVRDEDDENKQFNRS